MPFLITEYANGLQVADLELVQGGHLLPLKQWIDQFVTVHPRELTIRELIKSVADKGGGAHVDNWPNESLATMQSMGPAGVGCHVLYTVALARLGQQFGLYYTQFRDQFGFNGKLEDSVARFDPEHPSVVNRAKVSDALETGARSIYRYSVLKRIQ